MPVAIPPVRATRSIRSALLTCAGAPPPAPVPSRLTPLGIGLRRLSAQCTPPVLPICPSCGAQGILKQHRDRQRTDAAGHGRQRARDLGDRRMHVADRDRAAAIEVVQPLRARAERSARRRRALDSRLIPTSTTVAPGLTKSGVTNAGRPSAATRMSASAARLRQIDRPRVADRHRRVPVQQQQRHRLPDDVAAADDDGARAGDRDPRPFEQFDDARRRARDERRRDSAPGGRR